MKVGRDIILLKKICKIKKQLKTNKIIQIKKDHLNTIARESAHICHPYIFI